MLRIIQIAITLGFLSEALAAYGDLRISGGGNSGQLQFDDGYGYWRAVCKDGFGDDAGDVACRQLGYVQSSDVYVYYSYYSRTYDVNVCYTFCDGSEDRLTDCNLETASYCSCDSGKIVGITCTNGLTAGQIAGIVVGLVVFLALIATCVTLCICCLSPACPCYYHKYHTTRTVVAAQQTPRVVTATTTTTTTNTKTKNYQPPPLLDADYQPYPAAPPLATTVKY